MVTPPTPPPGKTKPANNDIAELKHVIREMAMLIMFMDEHPHYRVRDYINALSTDSDLRKYFH